MNKKMGLEWVLSTQFCSHSYYNTEIIDEKKTLTVF